MPKPISLQNDTVRALIQGAIFGLQTMPVGRGKADRETWARKREWVKRAITDAVSLVPFEVGDRARVAYAPSGIWGPAVFLAGTLSGLAKVKFPDVGDVWVEESRVTHEGLS